MPHAPDPARVLLAAAHADRTTDADLLRRFAAGGDGEAFALLVRRYGPMVLGVCRRVARHADDATQVTFLVLARKAAGLTARTPSGTGCTASRTGRR